MCLGIKNLGKLKEFMKEIRNQCDSYNKVAFNGKIQLNFAPSLSFLYFTFPLLLFQVIRSKEMTKLTSFNWLTIHSSAASASPRNLLEMYMLRHLASEAHWIRSSLVCTGCTEALWCVHSTLCFNNPPHDPEASSSRRLLAAD